MSYRAASRTVTVAATLDVVLGIAFGYANHIGIWSGLYFATTTATTVGYGDITPRGWLSHVLSVLIMLTVIPLFAATFSLFTSGLTSGNVKDHIKNSESEIKKHIEQLKGKKSEP